MTLWVWGAVLTGLVLCSYAMPNENEPQIAMVCGKVSQHMDLATGKWLTDTDRTADCLEEKDAILGYCRKVYPDLNITNIVEVADKVHIQTWCALGSSGACKGHGHYVAPIRCIVGKYQTPTLTVPSNCKFETKFDRKQCHGADFWYEEGGKICHSKGKTISKSKVLEPCSQIDTWVGVQFLCCDAPTKLHKPKPNKGNPTTEATPTVTAVKKQHANPICLQPRLIGACRALLPAWYYDADSGECTFFHYGGCGGNSNNFDSLEKCEEACLTGATKAKRNDDACGLPNETGMCRAFFPRWYYDPDLGECQTFVYGGCGGNENNFMQKDDCETHCKGYKRPVSLSTPSVKSPLVIPYDLGIGPVILDDPMEIKQTTESTTTQASTLSTVGITYGESPDIDSEHNLYINKLEALKSEHEAKQTKILGQYDKDKMGVNQQQKYLDDLKMDLQMTISSLEDEYDDKINKLNQLHKSRTDKILAGMRERTLQHFQNQLNVDSPKVRHVLSALEKCIDVEIADKTHTLQHLEMANNGESILELKNHLGDIEGRVNGTVSKLDAYPALLAVVRTDVENLLSKIPPSPEEEPDEDDEDVEEEIVDFLDNAEVEPRIKIDDGGLDIDSEDYSEICTKLYDSGPCLAAFTRFYFDIFDKKCKKFTYGGCDSNGNNFKTEQDCMNSCGERFLDENSISNAIVMDDDDESENESDLSQEVDKMFDTNGDLKPDFDVNINGMPQPLVSEDEDVDVKYGSAGITWFVWLGVGTAVLILLAIGIAIAGRKISNPPVSRVVVETEEESSKELTPEEKQLLQLQQNGYENPTYKFFEKQIA